LVPEAAGEQTVYLIPGFDDEGEAWEILERIYDEIFERELYGWHTVRSDWPQDRTLDTFCEWFDIELHSVVEDLCDWDLLDEDDG
jgi:hypothetical protein